MVYVDAPIWNYGRMKMCHMLADSEEELHTMAATIGINKKWFQNDRYPHYDICKSKRVLAIQNGAVEVDRKQFAQLAKKNLHE